MIQFEPVCCLAAACFILLFPLNWLFSVAAAAMVHECAHIISVLLFGGSIQRVCVSVSGCVIECSEMTDFEKVISILAGPACSLLLVYFRNTMPLIAVCGLIQGLYNLLPVLPLDGGRALQILLFHFWPQQEAVILRTIKYIFWFLGACVVIGIFYAEYGRV